VRTKSRTSVARGLQRRCSVGRLIADNGEAHVTGSQAVDDPPSPAGRSSPPQSRLWPGVLPVVLYIIAVLAVAHLFLLSPRIPASEAARACAVNVPVSKHMSWPLNCDSPAFLVLAAHPGHLFDQHQVWQSRPGLFVTAYLLTPVLSPLRALVGTDRYGLDDPRHLTYLVMNLALLVLALMAFERLLRRAAVPLFSFVVLAPLLLVNDVVKAFFWTPHTQIFLVVTPLLSILCCAWVLRIRDSVWWHLVLLGLGVGVLGLTYGIFLAVAIAVSLTILVAWWQRASHTYLELVVDLASFLAAFAVPQLAWIGAVQLKAGSYYSHEIEAYHQIVWIKEALGQGPGAFLDAFTANQALFGAATWPVVVWPLLLLAVIVVFRTTSKNRTTAGASIDRPLVLGSAITLVGFGVFLALLGFYEQRLSWSLVPPLLVIGALLLTDVGTESMPARRATAHAVVGVLVLLLCVWTFVKAGPWS
jgi:hypothetical protein